jgi:hypothetical protein
MDHRNTKDPWQQSKIKPIKAKNQPQLTTNAEDQFYPQQSGPSSPLDFYLARKGWG